MKLGRLNHIGVATPSIADSIVFYRDVMGATKIHEPFDLPDQGVKVCFVDTPGAYPGIDAEERGQSEAIARNLYVMAELKVPIIGIVIGEGGSGGALALGVVDQLIMLQCATYSVISPEGCASILWKSADKASTAAETLGITATRLKDLGLIDTILPEPLGGAHRNPNQLMETVRKSLKEHLTKLQKKPLKQLLDLRYERLLSYGKFKETAK